MKYCLDRSRHPVDYNSDFFFFLNVALTDASLVRHFKNY